MGTSPAANSAPPESKPGGRIVHFDAAGRIAIENEVLGFFFGTLDRELFGIPDEYQGIEIKY